MITLEDARMIVSAAQEKAREIGQPMNVAVMDGGRNLKAFARMDGAWLGSIDIAIDKAFTSASRGLSTSDIGEMAQPGRPLFGFDTLNKGRMVIFAGGVPLMRDGELVGVVGASGGTPEQDEEVAEAGAGASTSRLIVRQPPAACRACERKSNLTSGLLPSEAKIRA